MFQNLRGGRRGSAVGAQKKLNLTSDKAPLRYCWTMHDLLVTAKGIETKISVD